ncbi:MAG: sulfotransferase family protein [Deltaproteobacteria bacterium]|nr:sulfotransferase family protein [Deltaproteobacteria bacterium]
MSPGQAGLDPARTITIVSGLPRSGTSMMMQMLEAAGFEIATDGRRVADRDNPKGYYELDAVKRLREDASCLVEAVGRAVKVVAPLLPSLSDDHDYRVIFVERELDEVLASQRAMLDRTQASDAQPGDDTLKRAYENQLSEVKSWLVRQPNVRAVFVAHCLALRSPERVARSVADFLSATGGFPEDSSQPGARDSRIEAMARIVDARLHRHHLAAID